MPDVTRILLQIEAGDPVAGEMFLPLVYDELRKLAAAKLPGVEQRMVVAAAGHASFPLPSRFLPASFPLP